MSPTGIQDIRVPDRVECHSGYEYAERPTALFWEGERQEVDEILRSWRTPGKKCFRVLTSAEQVFDLCYDEQVDAWYIEPT